MRVPRFSTPLHVADNAGTRFVRNVDLTEMAVRKEEHDVAEVKRWEDGAGPQLHDLQRHLSAEERVWAREGRLVLPRFHEDLLDFWCRVPTVEERVSLLARLERIRHAEWDVDRARELAEVVRNARMADPSELDCLYLPGTEDYVNEIEEARERQLPEIERPERLATSDMATLLDYPLAFGARQLVWSGISADDVRELYENGDDFTVGSIESFIDASLVVHHEDAWSHLVDVGDLHEILTNWAARQDEGLGEESDLEADLAEWNGKQRLVSYYPDQSIVIPLSPNLSHTDLIEWCERRVERLEGKLAKLNDFMHAEPQQPVPQMM